MTPGIPWVLCCWMGAPRSLTKQDLFNDLSFNGGAEPLEALKVPGVGIWNAQSRVKSELGIGEFPICNCVFLLMVVRNLKKDGFYHVGRWKWCNMLIYCMTSYVSWFCSCLDVQFVKLQKSHCQPFKSLSASLGCMIHPHVFHMGSNSSPKTLMITGGCLRKKERAENSWKCSTSQLKLGYCKLCLPSSWRSTNLKGFEPDNGTWVNFRDPCSASKRNLSKLWSILPTKAGSCPFTMPL